MSHPVNLGVADEVVPLERDVELERLEAAGSTSRLEISYMHKMASTA